MKRIVLVVLVVVVALFSVGIAGAQEPEEGRRGRGGRHHLLQSVAEALDMTPQELRDALQAAGEDATLAQIIEANGGDVEAIQAQIVAEIVERTGKDAAEVEAKVSEKLNTPKSQREGRRGGDQAPATNS